MPSKSRSRKTGLPPEPRDKVTDAKLEFSDGAFDVVVCTVRYHPASRRRPQHPDAEGQHRNCQHQGKDQQGKSEKTLRGYNYRLGFFFDFTAQNNLRYLETDS